MSKLLAYKQIEEDIKSLEKGIPITGQNIRYKSLETFLRLLDKYGNLLVTIANADDSDEILAVLEQTAAPVQSYRLKRPANVFTASINLYPGAAFGYEYLDEPNATTMQGPKRGRVLAFTTPVGLSLNWGTGKGSISTFFSIIDIGAVTAFRLQDSVSTLPELAWKNIYAPGAYLMYGFPKSPLTLGFGAQYGPALRNVTSQGNETMASHIRYSASLTVDVPLYFVSKRTYCQKKSPRWK